MKKITYKSLILAMCAEILFCMITSAVFVTNAAGEISKRIFGTFNYSYAADVLEILNQERIKEGLSPLVLDESLTEAAMLRSAEIEIVFEHTRPNGTACFTAFNWQLAAGENIAAGYSTPESVMTGWMNSEGHRANILTAKFTRVGIGCFYSPEYPYRYYWTQVFSGGNTQSEYNPSGTKEVSVDVALTTNTETVVHFTDEGTLGDINGDNIIDVKDATMILEYKVELRNLTDNELILADVNHDNIVDVKDASLILQYQVELISEL